MPKLPMDYSKTIIYKIEHIDNDSLVYVGYTTNWDKRKSAHKFNCNNVNSSKYNLKIYQMIRDNGGWNMFRMIEVEKYPCNDKREAEKRECDVMKELKSIMNMRPSYVSEEEKKDKIKEYKKEYRGGNIDKIKTRDKEYYDKNKEKFKEYRELNIDKIKTRDKEYYEKNKERIKEKRKESMFCECGCEVTKPNFKRHQNSKKHIDLMKNKIIKENNKDKVLCKCGCEVTKPNFKRHQNSKKHIYLMKKKI